MQARSALQSRISHGRPARLAPQQLRTAARRPAVAVKAGEYDSLQGITVYAAGTGEPVDLLSLWNPNSELKVVIPFLTHFADLSSWEYGQKVVKVLPTLEASGVKVIAVGLGSADNAMEFSKYNQFPANQLYADPSGAAYKALGFNPGFLPDADISPYAKLLPMLAGIGSEGTLQEVIRGYIGDNNAKPVFDRPTPFDILGTGYQRPFELATLRLFNMISVLSKWGELFPPNQALLTQQGGTVAFQGSTTIFRQDDTGILRYTDLDALLREVLKAEEVPIDLTQLSDI